MIQGICAVSENMSIGENGHLPWEAKEDLAFFYNKTHGHIVVMGRKTFDALTQPLKGRLNYVITHRQIIKSNNVLPFQNKETILNLHGDIFIIGGLSVWQMFREDIKRWYITRIPGKYPGDVFFDLSLLTNFRKIDTISLTNHVAVDIYEHRQAE